MDFTHLQEHYHNLLSYLEKEGYTQSYIRLIQENIHWMFRNEKDKSWNSYINGKRWNTYRSPEKQLHISM